MNVTEAAAAKTELASGLAAGIEVLSLDQEVTFTPYTKVTIPVDGSVFWAISGAPKTFKGSFHYGTTTLQREDETISINQVIFTALESVNDLNDIAPDTIYIGVFEGQKFAFSSRKPFYKQADLYHYTGDAVYPAMETQLANSVADVSNAVVVSNSLPFWLTILPSCPVYPSFLVPANVRPPYVTVHISNTTPLQSVPVQAPIYAVDNYVAPGYWVDGYTVSPVIKPLQVIGTTHYQLVADTVRITTYGLRNDDALAYMDQILSYSLATDNIGLRNMPVFRDEKRTQTELGVLAIKKTIEFDVSYYQTRAYDVALTLIKSVLPTYLIGA